ncbi:MAG: hypothetical protein NTZ25_03280 [Candidatus Peregrinibacteria bacterium]|nr:hypothetical protein [Candidatus Peregrinibacteria bacterium]
MSLCINTTTPEGMVLAADSRQSYRNMKGMSRIGSDSASKIFQLGKRVGIVVAGLAFLPENGIQKNISRFIDEFKKQPDIEKFSIEKIGETLQKFFENKYKYKDELKKLPNQIKADLERQGCEVVEIKEEIGHVRFKFKDPNKLEKEGVAGVDQLQFIIAGFNSDDSHQVVKVCVPGEVEKMRDSKSKGMEYGASWIGQTDVISRIVLGFDGRIGNLPILQEAVTKFTPQVVQQQLRSLEYNIQWGTMTFQDGIDFSVLAIETTNAIQRFSDGIAGDPGDIPGVGGPADVAIITSEKGFTWVTKKNLRVGDKELDLQSIKNID